MKWKDAKPYVRIAIEWEHEKEWRLVYSREITSLRKKRPQFILEEIQAQSMKKYFGILRLRKKFLSILTVDWIPN